MNVGWTLACVGVASLLVLAAEVLSLAGIYQCLAAYVSLAAASLPAFVLKRIIAGIENGVSRTRNEMRVC